MSIVNNAALNIQEKVKNTITKGPVDNGLAERANRKIAALDKALRSPGVTGQVLRVLVGRLQHPQRNYTGKELEILLLLTAALKRAGMWP